MNIKDKYIEIFENIEDERVFDYELVEFSKQLIKKRNCIPKLYRYSIADYSNIRNLEKQQLFLSPIGNMNDIFEGLSCKIDDNVIKKIYELHNIAFVKSFSEEKNNLLMWAHYGDSYNGMCVEYDFSHLKEAYLYHLFPIYYSATRILRYDIDFLIKEYKGLQSANKELISVDECTFLTDFMSLFLVKSNVWAYEKEWRLLVTYPQLYNTSTDIGSEDVYELFDINEQIISVKGCIKGVYLGPKMKEDKKDHIREICKERLCDIPVYNTRNSKDRFAVEYCEI